MRLSKEQIRNGQKRGAAATKGRRTGLAAQIDGANSERRFAERRKQDASKALMLGLSAEFICNEIPAYLRGDRPDG